MIYTYKPSGVCSQLYNIEIEDNIIKSIEIIGGCNGNLKGISNLITGQDINWVISKLEGVQCGFKSTSCPDQIAKALKAYKNEQN